MPVVVSAFNLPQIANPATQDTIFSTAPVFLPVLEHIIPIQLVWSVSSVSAVAILAVMILYASPAAATSSTTVRV